MFDAMRDVVPQDLFFNAAQRRSRRRDLRHDIDAVAIILDHARQPANLTFNSLQSFKARRLDFLSHEDLYTPIGYAMQVRN